MQIVGQIIQGTVKVIDIYGKEQTLTKGQTIALGDTIRALGKEAKILFENNAEPVLLAGSDSIEVDDDFLAYLAEQALKGQEGVETILAEGEQEEDEARFIENDDDAQTNSSDRSLANASINSINAFNAGFRD